MTEMKQLAERLCNIVIGCANKPKKYSLISKITISDIYRKTYGQWKQKIQTVGLKNVQTIFWHEYVQTKILE
jgi:hypothetical protein